MFFSFDFFSSAGFALEMFYLHFEFIAISLGLLLNGCIPLGTYTFHQWKKQREEKTLSTAPPNKEGKKKSFLEPNSILIIGTAILFLINIILSWKWLHQKDIFDLSDFGVASYYFSLLITTFITVVYCLEFSIQKWKRVLYFFIALIGIAAILPEATTKFVSQALNHAKLGGDLLVTMDFQESREITKYQLESNIERIEGKQKSENSASIIGKSHEIARLGESAFRCSAFSQGRLVLETPNYLYVKTIADECDQSDSLSKDASRMIFIEVIDKSKLRRYRLFSN